MKGWENFRIQGKDYQEKIDNSSLVVGLYNQDSCIPLANFFTINLPTDCTEDVQYHTSFSSSSLRQPECHSSC